MAAPKTQHKSKAPLSETTRSATGSNQWFLEGETDKQTPVFQRNHLDVYICGEESFAKIAKDIRAAEESIDIAFWGFDPAMELERAEGSTTWPRGATWGDLLRDAAKRGVKVRLLVWWDLAVRLLAGTNMPGHDELQTELNKNPSTKDRRTYFNRKWYGDATSGRIQGLSLRTRSGVHADVVASLRREREEASARGRTTATEQLGLEWAATHHQKAIVIDFEGRNPLAYVMGLNSVTDYWDTSKHLFNDPRRGELFEGVSLDHSASEDWDDATPDKTTLRPYRDYVCRVQGEAVAAVCKNFTEAWNQATTRGKGGGSNVDRLIDLQNRPANLTARLSGVLHRAQILRTLPDKHGGENSIERLYYQASSFARHYLYIENQYFQNTDWVHALKEQRRRFVEERRTHKPPVPLADIPVLHLMAVTITPERKQMVPRTHDVLAELGHGDSIPNQDKMINDEIERHERLEKDYLNWVKRTSANGAPPTPFQIRQAVGSLSELAQSHKDAGGTKDSESAREMIRDTLGMRSLVVSLWTYDKEWSLADTPASRKAAAEQRRYEQKKKDWERYQQDRKKANAGDIAAGDWGIPMDVRSPPLPPPDRSKQIKNEAARRYREIYVHSKLMLIDDAMFTLGSANLNLRSFQVDSEINVASDDAATTKALRKYVWRQLAGEGLDGGDATQVQGMVNTFEDWLEEAKRNFSNKRNALSLTSLVVKFHDERTCIYRLG